MVIEIQVDQTAEEAQIEVVLRLEDTIAQSYIRLFVLNVEEIVKYLLSQMAVDQFTAVLVLRLKVADQTELQDETQDRALAAIPDQLLMQDQVMMLAREI